MFQNPFKGLKKMDYWVIGLLLVLAIGNWLLDPFKMTIKDYLTDWPPLVTYMVVVSSINVVVSMIVFNISGDRSENWFMGKQPQSAWRNAFLETLEKKEKDHKWRDSVLGLWLISLFVSVFIMGLVLMINLLFTETMNMFIICFAVYLLGRAFPNLGNLKWK